MWRYVVDKYSLLNKLYKNEKLAKELDNKFKTPLKKEEVKKFFIEYHKNINKESKKRKKKPERNVEVKSYERKGKKIKNYKKTSPKKYNDRQERFIISRKDYKIKTLTYEFNKYFNTSKTNFAIRDKKLRLLGKKK